MLLQAHFPGQTVSSHIPGKANDEAERSGLRVPPSEPCSDMGIRHRAMLQPTELHGLSTAAAATLRAFDADFASQERGGVRDGNDRTADSRANHFAQRLTSRGISRNDVIHLLRDPAQTAKLIGAFAWCIKQGHGLQQTQCPCAATIAGHVKAAALWLETEFRQTIHTCCLTASGASLGLQPLLSDLIASQRTWSKPQKKKEPFTFAIRTPPPRRVAGSQV